MNTRVDGMVDANERHYCGCYDQVAIIALSWLEAELDCDLIVAEPWRSC
ncbi:MAG TPA: hypothetical protein VGM32_15480 [Rhodopila sp.]|jgi:hypothetical protein